jgi:hypothetical protein
MGRHQTRGCASNAGITEVTQGKHSEVGLFPSGSVGYPSKVAMPSWCSFCDSAIGTGGVSSASQSRFERLTQLKPPALLGDIYSCVRRRRGEAGPGQISPNTMLDSAPYKKVDIDLPKVPKAEPRPKGATPKV